MGRESALNPEQSGSNEIRIHFDLIVQNNEKLVTAKKSDNSVGGKPWLSEYFSVSCACCNSILKIKLITHKRLEEESGKSATQTLLEAKPNKGVDLEDNNNDNEPMLSIPANNIKPDIPSEESESPPTTDSEAETEILPYVPITRAMYKQIHKNEINEADIAPPETNYNNNIDQGSSQETLDIYLPPSENGSDSDSTSDDDIEGPKKKRRTKKKRCISTSDEETEEPKPKRRTKKNHFISSDEEIEDEEPKKKLKAIQSKPIYCRGCYEMFPNHDEKNEHQKNHSLSCKFCRYTNKQFGTFASLATHVNRCHKDDHPIQGLKRTQDTPNHSTANEERTPVKIMDPVPSPSSQNPINQIANERTPIRIVDPVPGTSEESLVVTTPQKTEMPPPSTVATPISATKSDKSGNKKDGFTCDKCLKSFSPRKVFDQHLKHAHSPNNVKRWMEEAEARRDQLKAQAQRRCISANRRCISALDFSV